MSVYGCVWNCVLGWLYPLLGIFLNLSKSAG